MFGFEYPKNMDVGRVCFEISLKPFKKLDDDYIDSTCRELFDGWRDLLLYASSCAVMLWTSDGSEILEYTGNPDDAFEWGRYIGIGNPKEGYPPVNISDCKPEVTLHTQPVYYIDNPPVMHYSDLKRIISALKRVGKEMYGFDIEVGETFDPGPEFAYSEFKFHRHTEIARGNIMGAKLWIHCASKLHADNYTYAAYPNGIPEGTHFGKFLGLQFKALMRDVGFDFIWLSNGFGFSLNSWNWTGELFDGDKFDFTNAANVRSDINEFWTEFTAATGETRIETRGSNLSTGMDIAAHGSPIDDIYRTGTVVAPPNSPWAALNYRFGLELVGYMSHIAELPEKGYLFRYYTHDPWWHNSPWFDRYGRSPHDIYLPLSITRLDRNGNVTKPAGINFLSADDSYGNMPRRCPIEVTPHLLDAYSHYPDEAGLLTWVYPFDYYVKRGLNDGDMDKIFMDDWYIENAVDEGLPLNTVISDKEFISSDMENYRRTILLMPVPSAGNDEPFIKAAEAGLNILLYGNTSEASEKLKQILRITDSAPIEGKLKITTSLYNDITKDRDISDVLLHDALLSDGGITSIADNGCEVLAEVISGLEKRVYAAKNNNIVWIRGSFPHGRTKGSLPYALNKSEYFSSAILLRGALEHFGLKIRFITDNLNANKPIILNSRSDNALYITGFVKDTTMRALLSYPDGAPLMANYECIVENDTAEYPLRRWWFDECRLFVKQKERSTIYTERRTAEHPAIDHRFLIRNLKDAEMTFYPPIGASVRMVLNRAGMSDIDNVEKIISPDGRKVTAKNLTGDLYVAWQSN